MQKLVQKKQVALPQQEVIDDEGDSVREIRALRWKMNSEPVDLDEINGHLDLFGPPRRAARPRSIKK